MNDHALAVLNKAHADHSKVDMDPSGDADGESDKGNRDGGGDGDGHRNKNADGGGDGNGDGDGYGDTGNSDDNGLMNDKLQHRVLDHEEIDAKDDTPKAGDFLELKFVETVHPSDRDELGMPRQYLFFYTDADGPVISIEEEEGDYDDDEKPAQIITRWIFVAVTHVGSNFLLLQDLHKHEHRVHLDEWQDECRKVDDADARIQQSVNYWQSHLSEATRKIGELMRAVGIEGRQLAPDTQALAVQVGTGPAEEHKTALMKTREELPILYKHIERAGKNMGKWMGARALPMLAVSKSLEERQESIDSRLLAVDLYAGLSEEAVRCRHGQPAEFHEKLHLMQRMHYMDEECLVNYQHGGMDYGNIRDFDRWLAIRENFDRLLPHPRCAIAFRVRRDRKKRHGNSWADFVRIAFEEEQDRRTFLYLRNGNQLWRVECEHDFGERLFPDFAHSTITSGEQIWAKLDGSMFQTQGSLEQQYGEDWIEQARDDGFKLFDQSSVYFDDIQASISKVMGEYNRVAVLLQGLLDRSPALHPHPPIRLWDAKDFDTFVKLVFDKDRALVSGPAPDFKAYEAKLAAKIEPGSFTIGQEDFWWERERKRENERRANSSYYSYRETIYTESRWWNPPSDDPGPGYIAKVASMRGGRCRFNWMRKGRRQVAGSERWGDNYPQVKESIRVYSEDLFNVSAYEPGDYKQFFEDPRTRQEYLQWAPILLAAEEWYAQGGKFEQPIKGGR